MRRVFLSFGLLLVATAPTFSQSHELFGVTENGELVSVNISTGQATFVAQVGVTGYIAYDPGSDRFGIFTFDTQPGVLTLVDAETYQTSLQGPIGDLPPGEQKTGGIGYLGSPGRFGITFGQSGTFLEDRVADIGLNGIAVQLSPNLGIGDNDSLAWDAFNQRLIFTDYNADDGFPELIAVSDPFGMPAPSPVASLPTNGDAAGTAIDPETGRVFLASFDAGGGTLLEVVGGSYVTVGAFNVGSQVIDIAFAPIAPCRADLSDDGNLNATDINLFVSAFLDMTPIADFNADGNYNATDINLFVSAFLAGCD